MVFIICTLFMNADNQELNICFIIRFGYLLLHNKLCQSIPAYKAIILFACYSGDWLGLCWPFLLILLATLINFPNYTFCSVFYFDGSWGWNGQDRMFTYLFGALLVAGLSWNFVMADLGCQSLSSSLFLFLPPFPLFSPFYLLSPER